MMTIQTDQELNNELSGRGSVLNKTFPGNDIYSNVLGTKPYDYTPWTIFFYYIRIDTDGKLRVDHYFYPEGDPAKYYETPPNGWSEIHPNDLPEIVEKLAINARPSTTIKNPPKLPDHNFNNIVWQRRSYIVFFLDEEHWHFHKKGNGNSAIFFNEGKESTPNHTFYDGMDLTINMPDGAGGTTPRSAVAMINHMKENEKGDILYNGSQKFVFDIYLRVVFAQPDPNRLTVILDPGGTNQGPPTQP